MNKIFLLVIVFATQSAYSQSMDSNTKKVGSDSQHQNSCLWQDLMSQSPDLFIWGGDSIYADGIWKICFID